MITPPSPPSTSLYRGPSRSFVPIICALLVAGVAPKAALAEIKDWRGGDGDWTDPEKWTSSGAPGPLDDARFNNSVDSSVAIRAGESVELNLLNIRRSNVSISFASGSSLTTTSVRTGQRANEVAHLTFTGPGTGSATLSLGNLITGSPDAGDGHKVTFSGSGLNASAIAERSIIGRGSGSNELEVLDGAKLALHSLRIGYVDNSSGNKVSVKGAGSTLSFSNSSGAVVEIGAGVGVGVNGSQLIASDGGTISSSAAIRISQIAQTHSNSVTVTGANSKLEMLSGATLVVGAKNTPTGAGGSFVRVAQGGKLLTSGSIGIYGHDLASLADHGKNSLLVEAGGTLTQTAGDITIGENALLRLASGGTLASPSVQVSSGGRFEAEGGGLQATVVTIAGGAVLAVGVEGSEGAQQLTIGRSVTLDTGSFLEIDLHASGEGDLLVLDSQGSLVLKHGVTLRLSLAGYEPVLNDSWTLVSGNTGALSGEFELFEMPELQDGLSWDFSRLNEEGGWQLAVIPEPGTWLLTGLGGCALLAYSRRRVKRSAAAVQ